MFGRERPCPVDMVGTNPEPDLAAPPWEPFQSKVRREERPVTPPAEIPRIRRFWTKKLAASTGITDTKMAADIAPSPTPRKVLNPAMATGSVFARPPARTSA